MKDELPAAALPPFLYSSPAGFHLRDFNAFIRSGLFSPVSNSQERSHWATEENATLISRMFCTSPEGATPLSIQGANILVYNKSRDNDRICPACLRWYRVGEGFRSYSSLEEFRARPVLVQPEIEKDLATEQDLSGICTRECFKVLNEGNDDACGKDADKLSAEEVETLNTNPMSTLKVRKPTASEQAQGAKLVFMRRP